MSRSENIQPKRPDRQPDGTIPAIFQDPGTDKVYEALRAGTNLRCQEAKHFVEELWKKTAPYLDSDLPSHMGCEFHQRFWEMYLAATILSTDAHLRPRTSTRTSAGPDLCINDEPGKPIWIEAVAASRGSGPDAVQRDVFDRVCDVPDDEIKLRLLNAFDQKYHKGRKYVEQGIIGVSDPYVIAINAGTIPSADAEREPPRIVRTLLPIGDQEIYLDRNSLQTVGHGYGYQDSVRKLSGATVPTTSFLNPKYDSISAVLYASVDVFNHPPSFCLVHNPRALNPIKPSFLGCAREYWVEWDPQHGTTVDTVDTIRLCFDRHEMQCD